MPCYKRGSRRQYARKKKRRRTILIYNPTYGSLQRKSLSKTLPEEKSYWILSYASERPLTKSEIEQLLKKGKIGTCPDEFYLVKKRGRWTEEKVKKHLKQIKIFRKVNEKGEPFKWRDKYGNENDKIFLNFVPGSIVDFINRSSREKAIEGLTEFMLNQASTRDRRKKSFQEACRRHAERLVDSVRKGKVMKAPKPREPKIPNLW